MRRVHRIRNRQKAVSLKVYSTKEGGLLNLSGFHLIRFDSFVNKPYKLNLIGRNPDKFSSAPPVVNIKTYISID